MDLATLSYLWSMHRWTGVAVLVIGYLVQLTSKESKFPISVAPRWKPLLVALLSLAFAAAQAIDGGLPWRQVVLRGLMTGFLTMGLFDLIVNAFCNGQIPKWLAWIAVMTPQPPPPPAEKAVSIKPPPDPITEPETPDAKAK